MRTEVYRRLRLALAFQQVHRIQNDRDHLVITHRGIDHQVIEGPGWPVRAEVVGNKGHAVAVDSIDQILGFLKTFPDLCTLRNFSARGA